jgi:hypothetical protein
MTTSVSLDVSRKRVLPIFIGVAVGFVGGIWAIVDPVTGAIYRSEEVVRLVGILGGAAMAYATVRMGWLLIVSPGLELSPEALTVRIAGPPTRVVMWEELERVSFGKHHTFLHLKSGRRLRLNAWIEGVHGPFALSKVITDYGHSIGWS